MNDPSDTITLAEAADVFAEWREWMARDPDGFEAAVDSYHHHGEDFGLASARLMWATSARLRGKARLTLVPA